RLWWKDCRHLLACPYFNARRDIRKIVTGKSRLSSPVNISGARPAAEAMPGDSPNNQTLCSSRKGGLVFRYNPWAIIVLITAQSAVLPCPPKNLAGQRH
ncbi:MAG: hypothetical protein ACM3NH_02635, partial [Candidatus Saccharibacteria bacterium]